MVRGRIIGSEKIEERPLNTDASTRAPGVKAMSEKQMAFGLATRFAKAHAQSIDQSFDKTKYGSQRNYFMKVNYPGLAAAFSTLYAKIEDNATDTMAITDEELEQAVTDYATENPTAIYRIRKSGVPTVYLTGQWDDSANPIAATVTYNGSRLNNGDNSKELATGQILRIDGKGLSEGAITIGVASASNGSPSDVSIDTVLTSVTKSDTSVQGQVAETYNEQYLFTIKVGQNEVLRLVAHDDSGQGGFG